MIQVTYRNISILVNGKQIQSDKEPFIYQGSVFAPIRTIGEAVNKKIEWNDKENQMNIIDQEPVSLSFPLHKIGEKVIAYPYAIILKKVYHGKEDAIGRQFETELLMIDIEVECFAEHNKTLTYPFSLWDENNNKIAIMHRQGLNSLSFSKGRIYTGYLFYPYNEIKDKTKLKLVFFPVDIDYDPVDEINVFMAFDLGMIE
jgi:hypothetical protein